MNIQEENKQAAQIGVAIAGPQGALRAAIVAQAKSLHMFFVHVKNAADHNDGVLRLTPQIVHDFNNAIGSCGLLGEVLVLCDEASAAEEAMGPGAPVGPLN